MELSDRLSRLSLGERDRLERLLLGSSTRPATSAITRGDADTGPLSWAQQGVWLTQQLEPGSPAYHLALHTRWTGDVDGPALREALGVVVERHETLRTRILSDAGLPVQEIVPRVEVPLPVTDLSGVPHGERDALVHQLVCGVTDEPLELTRAPLLRAHLVRLADREALLLLTVHHLLADGASAWIVLDDLLTAYQAVRRQQPLAGQRAGVRYLDYAAWQRDRPESTFTGAVEHWRRHLAGHRGQLALPTDWPVPEQRSFEGARLPLRVGAGRLVELRELVARREATVFMAALATVYVVLHQLSGEPDLVVGVAADHRDRPETRDLVGLLVDMLPLRVRLAGTWTFTELLAEVREVVLAGLAHRDAPFEKVVDAVLDGRSASRSSLFQVAFTYQETAALSRSAETVQVRLVDLGVRATQFDMTFCLVGEGDELSGYLEYRSDLFRADTMAALGRHWDAVLAAVVAAPDAPIRDLPPLPPGAAGSVVPGQPPATAGGRVGTAGDQPKAGDGTDGPVDDDRVAQLRAIWAEVLGAEDVDDDCDFFVAGGNSLAATQLMLRLRARFDASLPLRSVFSHPTPAAFARYLHRNVRQDAAVTPALVEEADHRADQPLSLAQRRMWFVSRLEPDSARYSVPITLRLTGVLDVAALESSFTRVVARHSVLRSVYPQVKGEPVQRIRPPGPVRIDVLDLTSRPDPEQSGRQWLDAELASPFDLAEGPLLRVRQALISPTESLLLINLHHIVFDRWSGENLFTELAELYRAHTTGTEARLPELSAQFADVALWQQTWLRGPETARQLQYWRQELREPPAPLTLRMQQPRPARRTRPGGFVTFDLPGSVRAGVTALAGSDGTTPFMVLAAAFQALVASASGQDEFLMGVPIANRTRVEFEPLIGFFVNTLVLRADVSGDPTFTELLARVRRTALGAYANQDVPLDRIVEELRPAREGNRDPYVDIMLTYQNVPRGGGLRLPGLDVELLPISEWAAKRDFTIRIEDSDDAYRAVLEFDRELFRPEDMRGFAETFVSLLTRLVADPSAPLSRALATSGRRKREAMTDGKRRAAPGRRAFEQVISRAPATVAATEQEQVRVGALTDHPDALPLVMQASGASLDLTSWAAAHPDLIGRGLVAQGGVLFRDFEVASAIDFRQFAATQIAQLLDYQERSTPRREAGQKNVYTSTEYPADQYIELHNEMSYSHEWPMKIAFYCEHPAATGGATPVADSRRVYRMLDPDLRKPFEELGVTYVRNYGAGVDLPWQEAFQTDDREQVERYCAESGIDLRWRGADGLQTRQVRPAVHRHPVSGETTWFNSAHMFHVAGLDPQVRRSLTGLLDEEQWPRHAYYGDGSPIADDTIEAIRATYRAATVRFQWRRGDVMLLDNMLSCHGREPYTGRRKVLVAFGDAAGLSGSSPG